MGTLVYTREIPRAFEVAVPHVVSACNIFSARFKYTYE